MIVICMLCDSALYAELKSKARPATHFLSWVWSYALLTFVAALGGWVQSESLDAKQTFVWVCFFCNNVSGCALALRVDCTHLLCVQQFRLLSNADGLETVFEGMLKSVKYMVAMLDTWEQPVYGNDEPHSAYVVCMSEVALGLAVTRIWTVFEQYTAAKLGVDVKMILPPESMKSIHIAMSNNMQAVTQNLTQIDVESASASVPEDEEKVRSLIQQNSSFEHVNEAVRNSMRTWCTTAFADFLKV